jgi:uncharacterized membrane protein YphA (DoxX/SURF4 family)
MKTLTLISRIIVGCLFIFSGLIKANDPIGFSYKLQEYYHVFGVPFLGSTAVLQAILICALEIVLGIALLAGARKQLTVWLLLVLILFFTWLTGYSAIYNKVTDCGCFGDFLKLTPWQSFSKDIVLLVLIIFLLVGMKYIRPMFRPRTGDMIIAVSAILTIAFSTYCYYYLPVLDFLPYKEGANIQALMTVPEGAPKDEYKTVLIYKNKKTAEEKEYTADNLPWKDSVWMAEWEYKSTDSKKIKEGVKPEIHDFRMTDSEGNDVTDKLFEKDEYKLVIVEYDLNEARKGRVQEDLTKLTNDVMEKEKMEVFAITATPLAQAEAFRHEVQAPYTFYNADATALKTIIRSNPGLMLMKKNVVIKKWSACEIPDYFDLMRHCQ